jgi:hypothetical protein
MRSQLHNSALSGTFLLTFAGFKYLKEIMQIFKAVCVSLSLSYSGFLFTTNQAREEFLSRGCFFRGLSGFYFVLLRGLIFLQLLSLRYFAINL